MIEMEQLVKTYGRKTAVAGLTCTVRPGMVTGFVGPNGAGKSSTLHMLLGLTQPTSGTCHIDGRTYRDSPVPLREVGASLEAKAFHPGRRVVDHLRFLAAADGIPDSRVDDVLALVGLSTEARARARTLSLGMAQRLSLAAAMLGDPAVLLLDEPLNGLDPAGIVWLRELLRALADEGRTVLISSHLMNEMARTADHVLVLGRGRLLADVSVAELVARSGHGHLRARTDQPEALADCLQGIAVVQVGDEGELRIDAADGIDAQTVAVRAMAAGVILQELTFVPASLEDAFLQLTEDDVEYRAGSNE